MASLLAGRKLVTKDGSAAPADALEGKVVLKEEATYEKAMGAGDFVTVQKGTKVTWDVKEQFCGRQHRTGGASAEGEY